MNVPPIPTNEADRLAALRSLQILDTEPEERFDCITRIAQRAFHVPMALVSLVDAERQWFKSHQGLCACETSRDISFCGHAILNDIPLIVPNALNDPRFADNPLVLGDPNIRFYAGMPLKVLSTYRVGTLCLIDRNPRSFSRNETLLLHDLAQLAEQELAAGKTSLLVELQQRNQEMQLLSDLSDFLQASLTLTESFEVISQLMGSLFPSCSGGVFIICASRNRVEQGTVWGPHLHSVSEFAPHACWSLRRGSFHVIRPERMALKCGHVLDDPSVAATLCIPMIAQGETLGLFFLSSPNPDALTSAKQQLAHTVAEQIALTLANLNLRATLQNQSIRDPLTGLYNRHYFEETLQREIARAQAKQTEIGVIMVDIDHFKQFNDTYGQGTGDLVMQAIGKLLREQVWGVDIACRYGGEELTVILPDTTLEKAQAKANEIREAISLLKVPFHGKMVQQIHASLGVAGFPKHGNNRITLLQTAIAALHRAKGNGRNQVILAP
ncbi:MAG: diguanylate cyclase [Leptolyngbyaceae bacterium]|nr:diguanylate cyclase [Leptolyngbyaceae bacterium]